MIVIPMAGQSSRFFKANYKLPKYMLSLNGKTVFEHVLESFAKYFETEKFVFIVLENDFKPSQFVMDKVKELGIKSPLIVPLNEVTRGQAETIFLGLQKVKVDESEPLTIFNIDTFRPGFSFPEFVQAELCSYLETFIGSGKNWSNVVPVDSNSNLVKMAVEKQEASEFCCTGLYHWSNFSCFKKAYFDYEKAFPDKELYVAPMYNYAIQKNQTVRFTVVDKTEVVFCGTPEEYEYLVANYKTGF